MKLTKARALLTAAVTAALSVGGALQAHAEWPERVVKIVVPAAPGGAASLTAQTYANWLSEELGGSFIIENQGGGAGTIGGRYVVNSPADGYTFLWQNIVSMLMAPQIRDVDYNPSTDLELVVVPGGPISAMGVPAALGVNTVEEFIDMANEKPGEMNFGSAGVGSATHLPGITLEKATGIELTHVPYAGGAPAIVDLLAGRIQAVFEGGVLAHQGPDQLKVLAIIGPVRHPDYPDIPTITEAVPSFDLPSGHAIMAPKGTPPEIIAEMRAAIEKINSDPEKRKTLVGMNFLGANAEIDYATYLPTTYEYFGNLAKELDLKPE